MSVEEKVYQVDLLTRVEGEGSFYLRVRDGAVEEARLSIFEAPRFFEGILRGRSLFEVPDIVARICGICPVAYQMSALAAIEGALGVAPSEPIRALRRLLYCGEWIESHALHVFLLHAPDFLGYPSAIAMAQDHRELVLRGLALKKAGNALIALLGGRAIHPVSPRVGGFSKVPRRRDLLALRNPLQRGLDGAIEAVRWSASLPVPDFEQDYVFVALGGGGAYPLESGDRIQVSGRPDVPVADFERHFIEQQVPHSNALSCRLADGTPYLCGPLARLYHHADKLHPVAAAALRDHGVQLPVRNPYRSIVVRTVELVHAFAEALESDRRLRRARPPLRGGDTPRGVRRRSHGGAARPALAPLRAERGRPRRGRAHRPADLAEPGPHRARPRRRGALPPRAPARGGDAALRAAHPRLQSLHLLRDALPEAHHRSRGRSVSVVRVIALGNEAAGDDGAALAAARIAAAGGDVEVTCAGRPGVDLLDLLDGAAPVVLVDVVRTGAPPGTLVEMPLDAAVDRAVASAPSSSHGFGPAEALALGRSLGRALPRGVLLGIEGERFEVGAALSAGVEAAIPGLAAAIRRAVSGVEHDVGKQEPV